MSRKKKSKKQSRVKIDGGRAEHLSQTESIRTDEGRAEQLSQTESVQTDGGSAEQLSQTESVQSDGGSAEQLSQTESVQTDGGSAEQLSQTESAPSKKDEFEKELCVAIAKKIHTGHRKLEFPRRPEVGTLGKKIKLVSNCFPLHVPSGFVYHYDVKIVPKRKSSSDDKSKTVVEEEVGSSIAGDSEDTSSDESNVIEVASKGKSKKKYRCMNTKTNRQVIDAMLKQQDGFSEIYPAYDGKRNLITVKSLDFSTKKFKCEVLLKEEVPGDVDQQRCFRDVPFQVSIKPVIKKNPNDFAINLEPLHALFSGEVKSVPQEAVMALEIILRHSPCLRYVPVGRSFFYPPSPQDLHPLGGGNEIWFGHHQSLRLGQWKPMVNLDIAATTFFENGPLLKYVAGLLHKSVPKLRQIFSIEEYERRSINKELRHLQVKVTHINKGYQRKYTILKLTEESANRLTFWDSNTRAETTVARYFAERHNCRLEYPNLPCVQVKPEAKNIYLPIEVCEVIAGQHCKSVLSTEQRQEMIKVTARPPKKRFEEIQSIKKNADHNNDRCLNEFGLKVSNEPLKVEGRVLNTPSILYKQGNNEITIKPRDGSWNMIDKAFLKGAEMKSWVIISYAHSREMLGDFSEYICKLARKQGLVFGDLKSIEIISNHSFADVSKLLHNAKYTHKADLAVIVLPDTNPKNPRRWSPAEVNELYKDVKRISETDLGLVTQCIKADNVQFSASLVSNLCLKINSKMGGVNNSLVPGETPTILLEEPVIIIGADVTHPNPAEDINVSLSAAVGSLDSCGTRYAMKIDAQINEKENKKSEEIIRNLKEMVKDLLKAFHRNTRGKKPKKIIFYLDGVSEGEFVKVQDREIASIRAACKSLEPNYEPGITFIILQKRHHVRFRPEDEREGVGRMKNIPPGTTVDTTVTHPLNYDFFLCSHFGLQGTSRPGHYTVIHDDNNFSSDRLQKLTYHLCHISARCTKSISCPAPVQYAHLVAYRARQHLLSVRKELFSATKGPKDRKRDAMTIQEALKAVTIHASLQDRMYFV